MASPERTQSLDAEPDAKRALGAYYTPSDIALSLTRWALRDNPGRVLDPSYGICRFLAAAVDVLAASGVEHPARAVHGVDIDAEATASTTHALICKGARRSQFTVGDFFTVEPDARYAAVLGNPPYVRHHWQDPEVKASAAGAMRAAGVELSRRASLWAPFLIHADRFVKPAGRLAMLLPGAALQADYSEAVWEHLDALEETIVVLADRRTEGGGRAPLAVEIPTFAALRSALTEDPALLQMRKRGRRRNRVRSGLSVRRLLTIASEHPASKKLGDIADVRIGTVTGANALFVRTPDDELCRSVDDCHVISVVPGSRSLVGAVWTPADDEQAAVAGKRCRMLCLPATSVPSAALADALSKAELDGVHERSHCTKRKPWWALRAEQPPNAFLSYMTGDPKGIVLNQAGSGCINGVHRITWRTADGPACLLSTWTSLWALAVEQTARHYAGGVLKLEPGSAPQLPVVSHENPEALDELDGLIRLEGLRAARHLADRLVLADTLGFSPQQIRTIQTAALELAERRAPPIRQAP
jgi:adenine-specific DNA-methyltransferase